MQIYAHSQNEHSEFQSLNDHLKRTAKLCREFAGDFDSGELGYRLGLWHDLGKIDRKFQDKLVSQDQSIKVDHKFAGALIAQGYWAPISFLIACHHGGLTDLKGEFKSELQQKQKDLKLKQTVEEANRFLKSLQIEETPFPTQIQEHLPEFLRNNPSELEGEFFFRMLFSCLVDADFLDTENHLSPEKASFRGREWSMDELMEDFNRRHSEFGEAVSEVDALRNDVYQSCLKAAERAPGFFRLQVPTGGGKTLSSLAFALKHAKQHRLKRIIYSIPYTSIIDQTAGTFKEIFGYEKVLEHHNAFSLEVDEENFDPKVIRWKLAAENWDFPLIVTTTIQLFESIFSNKISKLRKIHNLSRSIIILDEAQTLPVNLLEPMLDVLQRLVRNYHTTVLLCTATQPAFDGNPYLKGIDEPINEVIAEPELLYSRLKRVEYEIPALEEKWSWERVAGEMRASEQALAVVNTRSDALALLEALEPGDDVFHLSTLLCGRHRRDVLDLVKKLLEADEPCLLVSTQVVEAGVDLDFPLALRALGPLDSIVQAAGRCNRNGRLKSGRVVVFEPEAGGMPKGTYRTGADCAVTILKRGLNLNEPDTYLEYFRCFYQMVDKGDKTIQEIRKNFDYPKVAERFKMIEDSTIPVIVDYRGLSGEKGMIDGILEGWGYKSPRALLRLLQPFMVNIYQKQVANFIREGLMKEIHPGLFRWLGSYNKKRGIIFENINPDDLVF